MIGTWAAYALHHGHSIARTATDQAVVQGTAELVAALTVAGEWQACQAILVIVLATLIHGAFDDRPCRGPQLTTLEASMAAQQE